MKQFAIIGLGTFGVRMLEKLSEVMGELVIVDRDPDVVEKYKELAASAFIVDALDEAALRRVLPEKLDAAIVDVGSNIEAAILITNSLKKIGLQEIIVKADSEERGEILEIIGATKVIYPDREAAARIVPMLVSPSLFNFMPIGQSLVMAEVKVPERYIGKTLIEANLRQRYGLNVVALRAIGGEEYQYFNADYRLAAEDVLLVAGKEKEIIEFSGASEEREKRGLGEIFKGLLKGKPGRGGKPSVESKDEGRKAI